MARLLVSALVVLLALCVGDKATQNLAERLCWGMLVVAVLADRWVCRGRLGFTVLLGIGVPLAGLAAGLLRGADLKVITSATVRYQPALLWLLLCWLSYPLIRRGCGDTPAARMRCSLVGFPLVCAGLALATSFASVDPRTSLKLFGAEAANYAMVYMVVLRLGLAGQLSWKGLRHGTRGILVFSIILMSLVVAAAVLGPERWGAWLRAHEWVRVEAGDPAAPWRVQFPFAHHNRAAFFVMVAGFSLCAAAVAGWGWRMVTTAAVASSLVCLLFTATRGALLGAVAGIAVVAVTLGVIRKSTRRWLVAVLLVAPAVWFVLPEAHQRQIRQVVEIQSYQPGPRTSIGARIALWRVTCNLIGERPLLGFGYGFEIFERVMGEREPVLLKEMQGLSHAHNMWLEVAVESGVPAAVVMGCFALLRCLALGGAWLRIRRNGAAANALAVWLALEVAILVYGMSNYPLRRSIGLLPWSIWALSAVFILTLGFSSPQTEPKAVHAQTDNPDPA